MTKRLVTALAAATLLFIAASPAGAACCAMQGQAMTSMHASMPCCAGTCKLTKPDRVRDHDATLTPARSTEQPLQNAVAPAPAASSTVVLVSFSCHGRSDATASDPPPFLLHQQFRI